MALLKISTAYTRTFLLIDSTDHISAKTGATVTVNIAKAGGAFGAAGGTVTEISNGFYKVALTTTDTNTIGDLSYHCTASGADATDFVDQVWNRTIDDLAFPATSGRSMVVDASGLVDANVVKVGPTGSGTAQTARDIGASVLLSTGTGTGQLDFTSGVVKANATQFAGQTITAGAGVTIPSSIASPTNITAGTITTVTNLTNAATAGDLTATMKTSVTTACTASTPTAAAVTAGVTVSTNNDKTGYSIASGGIGSGAHAAAELNNIADATLDRNMATGVDSGTDSTAVRTLRQSARAARNKVSIAAGVMTVTKEDDTTASWTAAISTTAGNPISTVDPT